MPAIPAANRGPDAPHIHRVAELAAAMSLASDLGIAEPLERGLRCTLLTVTLAKRAGAQGEQLSDIYYASLLAMAGCTASAPSDARLSGDELHLSRHLNPRFMGPQLGMAAAVVRHAGASDPPLRRVARVARAITSMPARMEEATLGHCDVAILIARRLGLAEGVASILDAVFERWDGTGQPSRLRRDGIPLGARANSVAWDIEIQGRIGGHDYALDILRQRSGKALDPDLCELVLSDPAGSFEVLEVDAPWSAVLDAEPAPRRVTDDEGLTASAASLGDFADLKSNYSRGHSREVGRLARDAASQLGFPAASVRVLERAGFVHDLGTVGVTAAVFARSGRMTEAQHEAIRLHPYWTERVVGRTSCLSGEAAIAGTHHERVDGSGYHRGLQSPLPDLGARILAAAEVFQSVREPRAHRGALSRDAAARLLREEAGAGRLDGNACEAVVAAAGGRAEIGPATRLTPRELEVVRLISAGLSTKKIASELQISTKTADHHVQHVYEKLGVRSRAGVAVMAMEHGWIGRRA